MVPFSKAKEIPCLEVFPPSRYQHIHNHRGYNVLVVSVQGESLEAFHANTSSKRQVAGQEGFTLTHLDIAVNNCTKLKQPAWW